MKIKLFTLIFIVFLLISGCSKDSKPEIVKLMIKKENPQTFYVVTTADGNKLNYAYYVYKDNKLLKKFPYKKDAYFTYKINQPGIYKVRVYVKDRTEEKDIQSTSSLTMGR